MAPWTWRRGSHSARYDRVYVHEGASDSVECVSMRALRQVWPALTDHVALHLVLRRRGSSSLDSHGGLVAASGAGHAGSFAQAVVACGNDGAAIEAGSAPREQVPVVRIANAIVSLDSAFKERAAACLRNLGEAGWSPEQAYPGEIKAMIEWDDLPAEGGFKIKQSGARGARCRVRHVDKLEQVQRYSKYVMWALVACGISEDEWRHLLEAAASVDKNKRGRDGLPAWLQRKNLTQCEHAVLLCRLAGLRKAATIDAPAEVGGSAFDAAAAQELERLLALSSAEVTQQQSSAYSTSPTS